MEVDRPVFLNHAEVIIADSDFVANCSLTLATLATGITLEVTMVPQELSEAILRFNLRGTPVKLPGLGIFDPSIDREGKYRLSYRANSVLNKGINVRCNLVNRERGGNTNE